MRDLKIEKAITEIEELTNGMIVCPAPDGKHYHMRAAYRLRKKLGRPLTNEEMAQFEIEKILTSQEKTPKESKMAG